MGNACASTSLMKLSLNVKLTLMSSWLMKFFSYSLKLGQVSIYYFKIATSYKKKHANQKVKHVCSISSVSLMTKYVHKNLSKLPTHEEIYGQTFRWMLGKNKRGFFVVEMTTSRDWIFWVRVVSGLVKIRLVTFRCFEMI